MTEHEEVNFCKIVGDRVKEQYDFNDGADLCFNLLESRVIPEEAGIDEAARIVAIHLAQY